MGKYMRKSKNTAEVSVVEVSHHHHQSPLFFGVRTRAKALALQRLAVSPAEAPSTTASGGSYLHLRSRRLKKPKPSDAKRHKKIQKGVSHVSNPSPNCNSLRLKVGSVDSVSVFGSGCWKEEDEDGQFERKKDVMKIQENSKNESVDFGIQAAFGENVLEFEKLERDKWEATPCSLLRDPDAMKTPDSTIRPCNLTEDNGTTHNSMPGHIPTTHDMDEFFSGVEDQQQKQFIEKYNFDPVNEKPLPGRYEWVKVDP